MTQQSRTSALEHPRRAMLLRCIAVNPGVSFNELLRETGLMSGTARHHLTVLQRCGLVIERPHRSTCRFFDSTRRHEGDWQAVVLLRDDELRTLYEWLQANPRASQKAIIETAESWGWSRSSTQHRLGRLVEGGLAHLHQQGRWKFYFAKPQVEQKPVAPMLEPLHAEVTLRRAGLPDSAQLQAMAMRREAAAPMLVTG